MFKINSKIITPTDGSAPPRAIMPEVLNLLLTAAKDSPCHHTQRFMALLERHRRGEPSVDAHLVHTELVRTAYSDDLLRNILHVVYREGGSALMLQDFTKVMGVVLVGSFGIEFGLSIPISTVSLGGSSLLSLFAALLLTAAVSGTTIGIAVAMYRVILSRFTEEFKKSFRQNFEQYSDEWACSFRQVSPKVACYLPSNRLTDKNS